MILINFILSLILGMIPEVLYFTLFLKFTKDIDKHIVKLFVLLAIGYVALIMICRYQLMFYLLYIVYGYLVLKVLYKSEIIDIFVYSLAFCYISLLSLIMYFVLDNYLVAYIINRLLLFVPFIFHKNLRNLYLKYRYMWNRHKDNKIKSITIRNSSLLMTNSMIILFDILSLLSLNLYK